MRPARRGCQTRPLTTQCAAAFFATHGQSMDACASLHFARALVCRRRHAPASWAPILPANDFQEAVDSAIASLAAAYARQCVSNFGPEAGVFAIGASTCKGAAAPASAGTSRVAMARSGGPLCASGMARQAAKTTSTPGIEPRTLRSRAWFWLPVRSVQPRPGACRIAPWPRVRFLRARQKRLGRIHRCHRCDPGSIPG